VAPRAITPYFGGRWELVHRVTSHEDFQVGRSQRYSMSLSDHRSLTQLIERMKNSSKRWGEAQGGTWPPKENEGDDLSDAGSGCRWSGRRTNCK